MAPLLPENRECFIWGHRGASAHAPENTLAAFRVAEAAGADGVELDVHLSRDGIPVVIHDETVERTTNGRGRVGELTLAQLQALDAGSWFAPRFAGERVPSLEEVFVWAGDRLRLNVEIKSSAAGKAVMQLLRKFPACRVLISSFDHRLLRQLRLSDPRLPLGFLVDSGFWRGAVARAAESGAESLHPRADRVSRPLLAACAERRLAVHCWTVNDAPRLQRLLLLGVDGVFSDDPALLRNLLDSRGGG